MEALFGYDVFISYAHADGEEYPQSLDRALEEDFTVHLDTRDYTPGKDLRLLTRVRVRNSRLLVVVGRPNALTDSHWVMREVEIFHRTGREPIIINVDNAVDTAIASPTKGSLAAWLAAKQELRADGTPVYTIILENDALQSVLKGPRVPQAHVIGRIRARFKGDRVESRRLKIVSAALLVVLLVAVFAVWQFVVASIKGREAFEQLSNVYWQKASAARDIEQNPVAAGWYFLKAADLSALAGDMEASRTALQALDSMSASLHRTFRSDAPVMNILFSEDQRRLVTLSRDGMARLWDVDSIEVLRTWKHGAVILGATFNGNDTRVLTWSMDGTVQLWDMENDEALRTWSHGSQVLGATFNGGNFRVLTWSEDNTVQLWDMENDEALRTWSHGSQVLGATFNGDSSRVLTWSADGASRLWDVESDTALRSWRHEGQVFGATFNEDSSRVLSWSADGMARLWDVQMNTALQTWRHESSCLGAIFNGDDSRVLSWDMDCTVRLWVMENEAAIQSWRHESQVLGATFNGDDTCVLTWSDDGAVRLGNVDRKSVV